MMKTLKVKSILFSLLTIIAMTVFMTSCSQKEHIGLNEAATHVDALPNIFLPHGYDEMSEEEVEDYMSTLSTEDFKKLSLHRKVVHFFMSLDKDEYLMNHASYGDIFDENTISKYLPEDEAGLFQSFSMQNLIASRYCSSWQYVGRAYLSNPCGTFDAYKRTCYPGTHVEYGYVLVEYCDYF